MSGAVELERLPADNFDTVCELLRWRDGSGMVLGCSGLGLVTAGMLSGDVRAGFVALPVAVWVTRKAFVASTAACGFIVSP